MLKKLPSLIIISWLIMVLPVLGQPSKAFCPNNLENLTNLLIKDIPSYGNRIIQRSRKLTRNSDLYSYIIIAGKPEFEPLNLVNREYKPIFEDNYKQVFFTTLERKYLNNQAIETQNYHWLFLGKNDNKWHLIRAFSSFGVSSPNNISTPPEDTTNSVIGQAVKLWLRDCKFPPKK